MQRYFVAEEYWQEDEVRLVEDAHHILRVMRFQINDRIICVHPKGQAAECNITHINEDNNQVRATITKWLDDHNELPVKVTILQSLPKGNKLELIIQKATELGATQFVLFQSERSVVKWNEKRMKNRLQRYEKIAKEASQQSGRNFIPEIIYTKDVEKFLQEDSLHSTSKLLAYEEEAKKATEGSFYSELRKMANNDHIIVSIGPEGGFSPEEVARFKEQGFTPIRLGKRILRTETAALYALASISYHFEEMN